MGEFTFTVDITDAKKTLTDYSAKALFAANEGIHEAGLFLEGEVKESIAGARAEPRSVDTGHFMQSVSTNNETILESEISSMVEYAQYLEYGTSRIQPRRHFQNTLVRNQDKVKAFVQDKISAL